ncbi:DUF1294 domain-containing protein [Brevundimonas sp. Root1279]|uniref:DUF1294 domain-containing protein n=1 Tax=Brevundimonas sp. Root1279 TaxID=1736443 RepID=UPI0006FA135B|nr:DUF1294 domain-containing protein [Brevundimonas sp. Root1279]KQW82317.1 hypothetical protein ASC65_08585 [Brevundimonas sp. Root1279]
MFPTLNLLLAAWAAASAVAFGLFAFDKARARGGGRRLPERTLLLAALLGGPGAWLGQQLLRHKTRKQPFATWLGLAVIVNLAAAAAGVWLLR